MKPAAITVLILIFFALSVNAQSREEFNGPLPGWVDIKKNFGAAGNGKTDDTKAFQTAINGFKNPVTRVNNGKGAYMVLFIPAGTYCISSTLVLQGQIGISIIGEDPAKTIIKWIGKDQDTMFLGNGSAYYRLSRLGWDANGKKGMTGIGIHWLRKWNDPGSRSFATLNIEISDNHFNGAFRYGINGGTFQGVDGTGSNDSEITIKRCVFINCEEAGVNIHGHNALDYWIWDCKFIGCRHGVFCKSGNYHIYRSYFSASGYFDVKNSGSFYTSLRGCFSENAWGFSVDDGASCNAFKRIFQNNTVLNLRAHPIVFLHIGKVTLWQNTFGKVIDPKVNFWVHTGSWCPAIFEIMSIKNRYETKEPLWNANGPLIKFAIGDKVEKNLSASAAEFIKTMEPTPIKKARKILAVPAGADSRIIQNLVDQAAALKGQRPVIYFAAGKYYLDRTLIIPAGSDMQLMGDGLLYASIITRAKSAAVQKAPLILAKGPSYISIKDLQIGEESDNQKAAALVFSNIDQPASQAHIDQLYSHADTSLIVDKMDYLYLEKNNSFFSDGTYLQGGSLVKQGKGTARVCCFGGQFAKLSVNNGAKFLAKDCWWEGKLRTPLDLKGSGEISLDGAMIAPWQADSLPTVRVGEFNGRVNLLNMYIHGSMAVDPGNSALNLLVWNINFFNKLNPYEYIKSGKSARIALLGANAQCLDNRPICKNVASIPDKIFRVDDTAGFIESNTSFDRGEKPVLYRNLPAGVSNIYISRVSIGSGNSGIVFTK